MRSTCCKCGTSIKNIVEINGAHYGTSCAEAVLGVKLPKKFSGDGLAFKKDKEAERLRFLEENRKMVDITKKGWNINIYFTHAYGYAGNEWEKKFVSSCARQCGAAILRDLKNGLTYDDAKRDWNDNYMGSFPYRIHDLNEKFNNLSDKQLSILDRIYSID